MTLRKLVLLWDIKKERQSQQVEHEDNVAVESDWSNEEHVYADEVDWL